MYCGPSTASEMFLIFTTQPYQCFSVIFLFALVSDEPEVFLPEYSQSAILHAAHFQRVVKISKMFDMECQYIGHHIHEILMELLPLPLILSVPLPHPAIRCVPI